MSKRKKITLLLLPIIPVILLCGVIGAVYFNQKSLVQKALLTINEQFVGILEIDDSHVAPFANFPYISIDLVGVRFYENKERDTKPLYEASDLYLGFDVLDLLKGQYHIRKIRIEKGHLDVVKSPDGEINLLLAKGLAGQDSTTTESEDFYFDLQQLVLSEFEFTYRDLATGQDIVAHVNEASLALKLAEDHIFMDISNQMVFDLDQDGEHTFFAEKKVGLDLELRYLRQEQKLLVSPSKLKLEEAFFTLEGQVDFDDDLDTDLRIYGEKPDFSVFAAFAPKEISETLKNYQNEGEIFFQGTIRGKAANGNMPAINVEFGCEDAYFLNKDANKKVDQLRFAGFYTNGADRSLKTSQLILQNFYAKPEEGIFQGTLTIRDFEDPYIKVNINADLDLEFLGEFFEIEGLQRLKGQVILDMDFDELIAMELPDQSLAQLKEGIDSELTIKNLSFLVPGYPHPIVNANGHAEMEKGSIRLDSLSFQIAGSDFSFDGELSDFPAVFHAFDKPIIASLNAKSKKIDLPEILSFDSALAAGTDEVIHDFSIKLAFKTAADQLSSFQYLPKGEFFIDDFYAKLENYDHTFHDFHADVIITDTDFKLIDFSGEIDKTDFHFTGSLQNYPKWFQEVKTGKTTVEFDMVSDYIHPADLLSYKGTQYVPEDYRHEEIRALKLHGKLEMNYDSTFKSADLHLEELQAQLKIHPLKLEKFKGRVHYEDEHVLVEDFSGNMGRSDFRVNMAYYTGDNPQIRKRDNFLSLTSRALDLDALMNYEHKPEENKSHEEAFNIFDIPFTDMRFTAEIGRMNYHNFWLEEVQGDLRITQDHFLYLDTLAMKAADGSLAIKGYFNGSDPEQIYFSSTMEADMLDLDKLLIKFENFGQDQLINENLHGKVSGTIESKFLVHPDFTPIIDKSEANMKLAVYEGSLVNFAPIQALSGYFKDKNLNNVRFDTLSNEFDLKDGVLHIPSMNINSSIGFIELSGRQSLDLNMDYFVRVPLNLVTQVGFRSLFGGKRREEVDPDQEDAIVYRNMDKRVRFLNINVSGTPEDYKISLGKDKGAVP